MNYVLQRLIPNQAVSPHVSNCTLSRAARCQLDSQDWLQKTIAVENTLKIFDDYFYLRITIKCKCFFYVYHNISKEYLVDHKLWSYLSHKRSVSVQIEKLI